jgi:hypothetical protein
MATPRILPEAYKDYENKFSMASMRGSNRMDLWCVVKGTVASYKTELNGKTLYDGPDSEAAAIAYRDAKLTTA